MIRNWLRKRAARRYQRGYEYAAGRLLRARTFQDAKQEVEILLGEAQRSRDIGIYDEFDRGVNAAVSDFAQFARRSG